MSGRRCRRGVATHTPEGSRHTPRDKGKSRAHWWSWGRGGSRAWSSARHTTRRSANVRPHYGGHNGTYNGEAHAGQCSVQPSGVSNSASRLHTSAPACRTRVWWREIIVRGPRGGQCPARSSGGDPGAGGPTAGRELLSELLSLFGLGAARLARLMVFFKTL